MQLDRDKLSSHPEFLPLSYLIAILSEMEEQGILFGDFFAWFGEWCGVVWCGGCCAENIKVPVYMFFSWFSYKSLRGTGECGCQVCGGNCTKTDSNQAGLWGQVNASRRMWRNGRTWCAKVGSWLTGIQGVVFSCVYAHSDNMLFNIQQPSSGIQMQPHTHIHTDIHCLLISNERKV